MLTLSQEQIDFFSNNNYLLISEAFSLDDINQIYQYAETLTLEKKFKKAGIGNVNYQLNTEIRNDLIYWIPDQSQQSIELSILNFFYNLKDQLNKHFFLSLKTSEVHFAHYQKNSFYKTHLDSFQNNNKRLISCVLYLNTNWLDSDGGQLRLYLDKKIIDITPSVNNLILFRSNLVEHEVLKCNRDRLSICAWLKN